MLNYVSCMSLLIVSYLFYSNHSYYQGFFSKSYSIFSFQVSALEILKYFVLFYAVVLIPYYFTLPVEYVTKSRKFFIAIRKFFTAAPIEKSERVAVLSTMVKFFFLPMMLIWFVDHVFAMSGNTLAVLRNWSFFPSGYWALFNLILFVDTFFFTVGYAVEHPWLKNEIRSVEPTLFGWIVVLACYPPFNGITSQMIGWYSSDMPNFNNEYLRYPAAIAALVLMAIYSWASVALNFKASNLTNRGIVTWGPYRYVRHPAYAAKNMAWWIGSVPIVSQLYYAGWSQFLFALGSVFGWSLIYYFRAITEERHLSLDNDYVEYCKKVKYRFIPKVI